MRKRKRAHHSAKCAWAQRRYPWCSPSKALRYMVAWQRMLRHSEIQRAKWITENHDDELPF
jgi:hypothetical protein